MSQSPHASPEPVFTAMTDLSAQADSTAVAATPSEAAPNSSNSKEILTLQKVAAIVRLPWADDPVGQALQKVLRKQRCYDTLTAVVLTAVLAVLGTIALVAIDRIWELSNASRQLQLRIALTLQLLMGTGFCAFALVRRIPLLKFAWKLDRTLGYRDDALLSYVELRQQDPLPASRREIAELLCLQAQARTQEFEIDPVLETKKTALAAYALGVAGLLFVGYGLSCGSGFFTSLKRVIMPGLELAAPRETVIREVRPGNAKIVAGEAISFEIRANGVLPENASLYYRFEGQAEDQKTILYHQGLGNYAAELPGFTKNVIYRIVCNDAHTKTYLLEPFDRPLVTAVRARIHPPPYAPLAPKQLLEGGNLEAVRGSRIEIFADTNQSVLNGTERDEPNAWIEFDNRRLPLKVSPQGLTSAFDLLRDTSYAIGYRASTGFSTGRGVSYKAIALPDRPPQAELERAQNQPAFATPQATLILKGSASDDLGLKRIILQYALNNGPALQLDLSPALPVQVWEEHLQLEVARLGAKDGDILRLQLQVEDVLTPTAQQAISKILDFRIQGRTPAHQGDPNHGRKLLPFKDPFADFLKTLHEQAQSQQQGQRPNPSPDETRQQSQDPREKLEQMLQQQMAVVEQLTQSDRGSDSEGNQQADASGQVRKQEQDDQGSDQGNQNKQKMKELGELERKLAEQLKELIDQLRDQQQQQAEQKQNSANEKDSESPDQSDTQPATSQHSGEQKKELSEPQRQRQQGQENSDATQSASAQAGDAQEDNNSPGKKSEDNRRSANDNPQRAPGAQQPGQDPEQTKPTQSSGGEPASPQERKSAENPQQRNAPKTPANGEDPPRSGGTGKLDHQSEQVGTQKGRSEEQQAAGTQGGGSGKNRSDSEQQRQGPSGESGDNRNDLATEIENLSELQRKMERLAERLEAGDNAADLEALARDTARAMQGFGRSFEQTDREKLKAAAERIKPEDPRAGLAPNQFSDRPEAEFKATKTKEVGSASTHTMRSEKGDYKEDELQQLIESSRARVAPEYREAIESYYKAISRGK